MRHAYTADDRDRVCSLYTGGQTARTIALTTGFSQSQIKRIVRARNLQRPSGRRCPQKDEVVRLYRAGLSFTQVAEKCGLSASTVQWHIQTVGISRSQSDALVRRWKGSRRLAINPNLTFASLTAATAWLLGLIIGDGHLASSGWLFGLTSGDHDVIAKAHAIAGGKIRSAGNHSTLYVHSVEIWRQLSQVLGYPGGHKSSTIRMPEIEMGLRRDLLRGLVDTDGSFFIQPSRSGSPLLRLVFYSCSKRLVEAFNEVVGEAIGIRKRIYEYGNRRSPRGRPCKPMHSVVYSHEEAVAVGRWLYAESTDATRCDRKYQIWLKGASA